MAGISEQSPQDHSRGNGNGWKTVQLSELAAALDMPQVQARFSEPIAAQTSFSELSVLDKFLNCAGSVDRGDTAETRKGNLAEAFDAALAVPIQDRVVRVVVFAPWDIRKQMTTGRADLVGNAVCAFVPDPNPKIGTRTPVIYDTDIMKYVDISRGDIFNQADRVDPERPTDAYRRYRDNIGFINGLITEEKTDLEWRRGYRIELAHRSVDVHTPAVVSNAMEARNQEKELAVRNYLVATQQLEMGPQWTREGIKPLKPLFVVEDGNDNNHVQLLVWQLRDLNQKWRYRFKDAQECLADSKHSFSVGINLDKVRAAAKRYVSDSSSPDYITAAHTTLGILLSPEVRERRRDGRGGSATLDRFAEAA